MLKERIRESLGARKLRRQLPADSRSAETEKIVDLRWAIRRMKKPEDQELVIRRYFQGLEIGDIARMYGINKKTVSSRLARARQELRLLLEDEDR